MMRTDWMFEPLSPSPLESAAETADLGNLLEEDDLLDEALMILAQDDKKGGKKEDLSGPSGGLENAILESLASGLDHEEDAGLHKLGHGDDGFNFAGEIKRAFSPIKTIVFDYAERGGAGVEPYPDLNSASDSEEHRESPSSESAGRLHSQPEDKRRQQQQEQHQQHQLQAQQNQYQQQQVQQHQMHYQQQMQQMQYANQYQQHQHQHQHVHPHVATQQYPNGFGYHANQHPGQMKVGSNSGRKEVIQHRSLVPSPVNSSGSPRSASEDSEIQLNSNKHAVNQDPWPSAKEYHDVFKQFLDDDTKFTRYSTAQLGKCKLTGTPLQPEWLYTKPRSGIYFIECENLRGKGSFGFPKCDTLGKKTFEWKKTSYVNNVPKAKPVISYITANGNGKASDGSPVSYRMRIIKPLGLSPEKMQVAVKWCLVDIHKSAGLARRNGPRPQKKTIQGLYNPAAAHSFRPSPPPLKHSIGVPARYPIKPPGVPSASYTGPIGDDRQRINASMHSFSYGGPQHQIMSKVASGYGSPHSEYREHHDGRHETQSQHHEGPAAEDKGAGLKLETNLKPRPFVHIADSVRAGHVPLSPMKRLSLATSDAELASQQGMAHMMTGSPKGKKMQRISSATSGNSSAIN